MILFVSSITKNERLFDPSIPTKMICLAANSADGRIGVNGDVGLQSHPLDTVPGDNLALIGSNNFQSVKATHAVYKGKKAISSNTKCLFLSKQLGTANVD